MDQPQAVSAVLGHFSAFYSQPPTSVRSRNYDPHMPADDPDHSYNDARAQRPTQNVTNAYWPKNAADSRAWPDREPIDVRIRVELEHDGEEWIDGVALRWDRSRVCCSVNDPRVAAGFVWVRAADISRR